MGAFRQFRPLRLLVTERMLLEDPLPASIPG